jgi:Family of unknown function (DUF5522)
MKTTKKQNEQPDYYFENGLMVFTEAYHLKRGFCCQNRCRHCPYGLAPKANRNS